MSSTETYTLPTENHGTSGTSVSKLWQSMRTRQQSKRRSSLVDTNDDDAHNSLDRLSSSKSHSEEHWWQIHWGSGMWHDFRRRYPLFVSDWTDAWDYRVVPATVYMYFANILPALAFSLDMFEKTNNSYGVNEVLLSSVLGAVVFSCLAAQPLVIVGVTGPITVFSYTVYDIVVPKGTDFFAFMCLIGLWSLAMHWFLAASNSCNGLRYVTRFSCDTFGFYVAFIYLQKGIQVLVRQFAVGDASAYLSIMVSLLVLMVAYACGIVGGSSLFHRILRKFIEDYGTPLTIIFFTGFVHIGKMEGITIPTLPTSRAFFPTKDRDWFVSPTGTSVGDVFVAIPFGVLLTILFWFDHNVSSLIAQGTEFPLRKPAGFHWDIFLLGLTTGVAGLLGIPFPNGLIPQAPFHTNALCVTRQVVRQNEKRNDDMEAGGGQGDSSNSNTPVRVVDHVVEQRVSNLAQGLLTLGTMSGPLLVVLALIPQAVLAGLFFVMGVQALEGNGITLKLLYLLRDNSLYPSAATDENAALRALPRQHMVWAFVLLELVGFGATFAITQTIAAIGFPVIILALIPLRAFVMPRWFSPDELRALDAPTASPFTMESVGGVHGTLAPLEGASPDDDDDDNAANADADDTSSGRRSTALSYTEQGQGPQQRRSSVLRRTSTSVGRAPSVAVVDEDEKLDAAAIAAEEEDAAAAAAAGRVTFSARVTSPVRQRASSRGALGATRRRTSSRRARPGAEIWGDDPRAYLPEGESDTAAAVPDDLAAAAGGGAALGARVSSASPVQQRRRRYSGFSGGQSPSVELERLDYGSRSRSRSKVGRMGNREF